MPDSSPQRTQRLRVLQIVTNFGYGGAERVAMHLLLNSDPERFESAALSLYPPVGSDIEEELSAAGIPKWYCDKEVGPDWKLFGRIRAVLDEFQPDIVHTHLAGLRYAAWPMWRARVPAAVHTLHNVATQEAFPIVRFVQKIAFRWRVRPVAIAERVRESFKETYRWSNPIELIPNGVPLATYRTPGLERSAWRSQIGIPAGAIVFACIARLQPQKNHALLIDAFAEVAREHTDAFLLLVGSESTLGPQLKEQAAGTNASDRILFAGTRSDIPDVLNASDAFVLASDWEGNPLTVMEAMAAGLPPICTAVGGVPELIEDGRTGYLVPPGNRAELAGAMARVVDADVRATLGNAASRHAEDAFSDVAMTRRYEALYLELLRDS
ncbi:MAG: glycosyltransferase [Bacteroidota bacterium]